MWIHQTNKTTTSESNCAPATACPTQLMSPAHGDSSTEGEALIHKICENKCLTIGLETTSTNIPLEPTLTKTANSCCGAACRLDNQYQHFSAFVLVHRQVSTTLPA